MLHPEEATHRSSQIAVDIAYLVARYIDTLGHFISKKELFHIQLQTLYVLIDLMCLTSTSEPDAVLDECRNYFRRLRNNETVGNQ